MAATSGSTESKVQAFVHTLEQGKLALIVRIVLVLVIILGVALVFLGWRFRGFADPAAMDAAQIGREIARGHGWTTKFIRPAAIWQIETNLGTLPKSEFPDTFNAPLPPLLDSAAFLMAGTKIDYKPREFIAPAERFIVALEMLCFLASIAVLYFLLRRVFDQRLAFWASTITLVSNACWQYCLSGLPQMLMLLIFNLMLYALVRAVELNKAIEVSTGEKMASGETAPVPTGAFTFQVMLWLAATGIFGGLLVLTHAVAIWVFVGALIYAIVAFRRRGPAFLVMILAFALVYVPWLVRTYQVSGSPFGTAIYAVYDGLNGSTAAHMRSAEGPLTSLIQPQFFRTKLQYGFLDELGGLIGGMGSNIIVAAFFLSLLHPFRRVEAASLRWGVLTMWLLAAIGMAVLSNGHTDPAQISANQIDIIFMPVMVGFGLAFILVLFSRREGSTRTLAQLTLFTVLLVASVFPLIFGLLPRNISPIQYPPYIEPALAKLGDWTNDREIVATDMPWATALYADRKSLWLPDRFKDLLGLSDNAKLPGTLAGVFISPVGRDVPFYSAIYRGEYQDYQPLIFGRPDLPLFPFQKVSMFLGDLSYTFYSDTARWERDRKMSPAASPAASPGPSPEESPTSTDLAAPALNPTQTVAPLPTGTPEPSPSPR